MKKATLTRNINLALIASASVASAGTDPVGQQPAQESAEGDLHPRGANDDMGAEVGAAIQLPSRLVDNHHAPFGVVGVDSMFTRNPVDLRRLNGQLVNHEERAIMEYDDTALRNSGTALGWADVVGVGFDAAQLTTYSNTGKERNVDRLKFNLFETSNPKRQFSQVWWNDETCLPQELVTTTPAGIQSSKVVAIKHGADPEVLKAAGLRYPKYTVVEAIDWLEKVHDHAGAKHGAQAGHQHGLAHAED